VNNQETQGTTNQPDSGFGSSHCYAVGDRVRMRETITEGPSEELPAQHFCEKGEVLIVRKVTDENRPRNGVWPVYVSHEHITDRSFGVMLNQIELDWPPACRHGVKGPCGECQARI